MLTSPRYRAVLLWIAVIPLTGCLFRSHKIEQRVSNAQLKVATQQDLVSWLNQEANRIQSLNATVDIAADVGGEKKGKLTQYQEIRGYILARKPEMLRMIGLLPIVRNRAFDMVSDGRGFKLWIPPKNKFYVGSNNDFSTISTNPLENLRPKIIEDALLLHPVTAQDQIAVLDNGTQTVTDPKSKKPVDQPDYELLIIERSQGGGWYLARKFVFDRTTLLPSRQIIYDKKGAVATDAKYGEFKDYDGVPFPSVIEIRRPEEEYTITIGLVKATINKPLTDDQFALTQPPGSQVVRLGEKAQGSQAARGDGEASK